MTDRIGVDVTDSTQAPVWRRHPQHHLIEVSDQGQVRTVAYIGDGVTGRRGWRYATRLRRQTLSGDGYPTVQVGRVMVKVHLLVLETFVGPCPPGMEALHGDANRANPKLDNLRYGTRSENQLQRVADGNHHLANKTRCKRGHLLIVPNLRPQGLAHGKRQCRACDLGLQYARRHPGVDVQSTCDRFYTITE